MSTASFDPLRYLSASDVMAAMPPIDERLALAERTLTALVGDAQLPPKIGVHPRPEASFVHAMPAWAGGADADGRGDLLGMKWVAGFPTNADRSVSGGTSSLPTIHGTVILNDALTGVPRAILDAGPITAQRTAAVSGVAIARWGPAGSGARVAVIGAGVQARSHLPVIGRLLPGSRIVVCDRDRARAEALAGDARSGAFGVDAFAEVTTVTDPAAAAEGADLVVTLVSFGATRGIVPAEAFGADATIVAADYDMCVPAATADGAELFLVDDRAQFEATRAGAVFGGYRDPDGMIGEAVRDRVPRPAGRVLVTHLGVGLADVVFGDAILRTAEGLGLGTLLPR